MSACVCWKIFALLCFTTGVEGCKQDTSVRLLSYRRPGSWPFLVFYSLFLFFSLRQSAVLLGLSLFYDSLYRETMAFADESVVCWTVTDSAAAAKRGSLPTIKQYNSVLQSLSLHRDRQHKRRHDELGRKTKKIRKKAKGKRTYGPAATIAWDWWGFFGGSYGYLPPSLS